MCKLLKRLFGGFRPRIKISLVRPIEAWTVDNAIALNAFLRSPTGQKLIDQMRYRITAGLLHRDLTEDERVLLRALTLTIEGIESNADVEYWRAQVRTDQPEQAYRYLPEDEDENAE